MTTPTALNAGEPARVGAGCDTVTLVEGATFCLSDRHGYVVAGGSHGLFFRDARVLSRWELRVDGQVAESLSVESSEAFAAQFILRRAPRPGVADSTLLVVRERLVADGLRETLTLSNLGREPTVVSLELHADADFADLFAVKEGRAPLGGAEMTVADGELMLAERTERVHGLSVTASGDPICYPGRCAGGSSCRPRSAGRPRSSPNPPGTTKKSRRGCAAASTWPPAPRPARSRPGATRRPMSKPVIRCWARCCGKPKATWGRCSYMTTPVAATRSSQPERRGL